MYIVTSFAHAFMLSAGKFPALSACRVNLLCVLIGSFVYVRLCGWLE